MNLVCGQIMEAEACEAVLESLEERVLKTLSKPKLAPELVIRACDRLIASMERPKYQDMIASFGFSERMREQYVSEIRNLFSGEALRYRMEKEFGSDYDRAVTYVPISGGPMVTEEILPLGVLLHVAAGNADGLPAFSVLEGLLTGNINILKLPAAEEGISIRLLQELAHLEPALAEYIYVFDYSSKDVIHMNKLIEVADAVVLWGGVEAVTAFRHLLPPNIKLIEWGHKLSFAYVTKEGLSKVALRGVAQNVALTRQLLCNSCQGIFLDTEDMNDVYEFCETFLPILEKEISRREEKRTMDQDAQEALQKYSAELEAIFTGDRLFKGEACSLIACADQKLEESKGMAQLWVKPLPRKSLLQLLRPYKNYLQTVALCCGKEEAHEIRECLLKTGVVRVCSGERMSDTYPGAPHDGEYPLRRYIKIGSVE